MNSQHDSPTADSARSMAETILSKLQARGIRRTPALRSLIHAMAAHSSPASIAYWAGLVSLREYNPVTLYRLMMKLEQGGMVRRVYLGERAQCFQLIRPGPQPDYLVCTHCGELQPVQPLPELHSLEQQLAAHSGWQAVRHELEFFGLCPDCTAPRTQEQAHPAAR